MDFLIVGAGAVGGVLGTLLSAAGHRVQFWVRPGGVLPALSIERAGRPRTLLESPRVASRADSVPASDWVLVCVRTEQLMAALEEVAQRVGPERRVAIATVSLTRVTELARAAGLTGPIFALHASFIAYADPDTEGHYRWFPLLLPTTITPDGVRKQRAQAEQLAAALARAGLPTRAALSMARRMRVLTAAISVVALSWDLCEWQFERLARNAELRRTTARALSETISRPRLPVWLFDLTLRLVPYTVGAKGRSAWRQHGPKIRAQTDVIVRELLARAPDASALLSLHEAWSTQCLPKPS